MKKSGISLYLSAAVIMLSLFVTSCHREKTTAEDTSYATDYAKAEKTINDVQTVADQAATANGSVALRETTSACAVVTHAASGSDSVTTIDFGATDCLCKDGSYRRGQIIITYSGSYTAMGSVHTITFNNFYHNDNHVTGTKTVTYNGLNASGQKYYSIVVNCSITNTNGEVHTANWTRTRTWITEGTPNVYQITGSGTLVRPNGRTVGVTITSPLVIASDCRWIEAGSVTHSLPSGLSRTVNYGNSAVCDDVATVTLPNGTTRQVTLP
jgi:hypothetical protein